MNDDYFLRNFVVFVVFFSVIDYDYTFHVLSVLIFQNIFFLFVPISVSNFKAIFFPLIINCFSFVCFFFSTESGWDNPFRPGGDLSREADEIVNLIKGKCRKMMQWKWKVLTQCLVFGTRNWIKESYKKWTWTMNIHSK